MRKLLPILILTFMYHGTSAQWLSGKVKGESGSAAESVSVSFMNKGNSFATNADGSFKIFAPNLPDTLVFTSSGYEPYKVLITEKNIADPNFEVVLLNKRIKRELLFPEAPGKSSGALEEVVVSAARGTRLKRGSAVVKKDMREYSASSYSTTLSGDASPAYSSSHTAINSRKLYSKDSTIARAGALTAGEINDFAKWKLWSDLSADEFGQYSRKWNVEMQERYSVQLVDKKGNGVKNEKVYLLNINTGDTAWKAVTDNTGKAELWGSVETLIESKTMVTSFRIATVGGGKLSNPAKFENGVNVVSVEKECRTSNIVDIAFVVDATGSMDDELEFLKLELEDLLQKTTSTYGQLSLRYSSVFYRDNGDEYVTRKLDFQTEMLKVLNFIKLQKSGGGGDFPEAVDAALDVAINELAWSENSRAKILFLLLDAPPHDEAKTRIRLLISRAAEKGIKIIPIASSGVDKSTEFILRSMALGTNGTYTFLTNHSAIGNAHIEPSTDNYSVELLGTLLKRLLDQALYAAECNSQDITQVPVVLIEQPVKLKIYPNPTTGRFKIQSNNEIKEIYVADFSGKLLLKINTNSKAGTWDVNIEPYPSGIYLIKYVTVAGKVGAEKIILMR